MKKIAEIRQVGMMIWAVAFEPQTRHGRANAVFPTPGSAMTYAQGFGHNLPWEFAPMPPTTGDFDVIRCDG